MRRLSVLPNFCIKSGKREYTNKPYDNIRIEVAKIMKYVYYDVKVELNLHALEENSFDEKSTYTEDNARFDIQANFV